MIFMIFGKKNMNSSKVISSSKDNRNIMKKLNENSKICITSGKDLTLIAWDYDEARLEKVLNLR